MHHSKGRGRPRPFFTLTPEASPADTASVNGPRQTVSRDERGFTLIELLVVIIILGILLGIAIPSYLTFRGRANKSAAQANVRAAVPGMEAFNADHATGYVGVNLAKLQASYDSGIKSVTIRAATQGGYCLENTSPGTVTYHKSGPSGDIRSGSC